MLIRVVKLIRCDRARLLNVYRIRTAEIINYRLSIIDTILSLYGIIPGRKEPYRGVRCMS